MGKYSASLIFIYRSHALLAKVRTFSPKVIVNKLEFWCNKKIQSAALNPIAALNCAATVDIENDYFFHQLSQNMTIYFTYVLYMFSIKIFWVWCSNPCHGSSIVLFNFRFFVKKIEYCYEETKNHSHSKYVSLILSIDFSDWSKRSKQSLNQSEANIKLIDHVTWQVTCLAPLLFIFLHWVLTSSLARFVSFPEIQFALFKQKFQPLPPPPATNLLASLSELYSRHDRVGRGMAVVNGF